MPTVYEHLHAVTAHDIDRQGHANNLRFLQWMIDAAVAHSAAQGWPSERYEESGAGWVVRRHAIQYFASAFDGDEIVVQTWVSELGKATSVRQYRIFNCQSAVLLAGGETEWAFIGFEHRVPRRIPQDVRSAFDVVGTEPEKPARCHADKDSIIDEEDESVQ